MKKITGYLPDNVGFYPDMTGRQNLRFTGRLNGLQGEELEKRIDEMLKRVGMTNAADRKTGTYSRGMKQRLGIAIALLGHPKLLVLDEPFVGLDPSASVVLKQNMHALCEEGSAIFFSTHVLDVAEKLCNKIAIIKNGELVVSGETSELTHGKSLEEVFMEVVKGD